VQWEAERDLARIKDQQGLVAEADRGYRRAIGRIETSRTSINHEELRMSFLSTGIEVYGDYIDFLIRHRKPSDALNQAELSRARTLAEGLAPTNGATSRASPSVPPQQIAQKLNASLLFYWIGQKNSYVWVITPVKTSYFKLSPASVIDPVLADYRRALLTMHDAQDDGSAEGRRLYAMLVEPAKKLVPPGSRVVILPSENLYGLNFETLIVPDPQPHFWIEDVILTTGSSLTMLAASATQTPPKDKSLFLVGDTKPPNPPFAPLPQAAEEMKQVRKYFPRAQTRILEGERATPTAFLKSNPEQFSYLHFVTHGTASHTRPLESAVILSQDGDSYKLYASDIVQHRLNANLVTISACNGAGTRAYSGEGLVGLSWAFLRAGAHNVIGALWEVSDASTPQLMDAFYGELFQGKDTATALRNAKLGLLRSSDPDSVFRKPFYWAPFQLYAGS
jgi:CHAT domain-containing protein